MNLTAEQLEAIAHGEPVSLTIDETPCVVLREDVYRRVEQSIREDHDDLRAVFARSVESSDWNDPAMDIYDRYDEEG